jgi:hypothetical protein
MQYKKHDCLQIAGQPSSRQPSASQQKKQQQSNPQNLGGGGGGVQQASCLETPSPDWAGLNVVQVETEPLMSNQLRKFIRSIEKNVAPLNIYVIRTPY